MNRDSFFKFYANLPINVRREVVLDLGNNDGGPDTLQKDEQHDDRQGPADKDVVPHQLDGRFDVDRLVVHLSEVQRRVNGGQDFGVDLGHLLLDVGDGRNHVGAGLATNRHGDDELAFTTNEGELLLESIDHLGYVADADRSALPVGDDCG